MKNKKFWLGEKIRDISLDFDGRKLEVIKYHPHKKDKNGYLLTEIDREKIKYNCPEISESWNNIFCLVISWIAYSKLGLNNHSLILGITKALDLYKP